MFSSADKRCDAQPGIVSRETHGTVNSDHLKMLENRKRASAEQSIAAGEGNGNGRLLSIREVSALTGVAPHTLRFWEKEMPAVLRPIRTPGGQRRYSSETVERIRTIRYLSIEERYPLATIRERLGATQKAIESLHDSATNLAADRTISRFAVERLVDEVADLLKERLLGLLANGSLSENNSGEVERTMPHET
jgi:DNA-binding transcriptional MerR regulator